MKNKILISVIIVHYKVKKELFLCLKSLYANNPKILFEVIVVDNDEEKKIENDLFKKFPKVKYIKSKSNIGYGGGNNLGVKYAKGNFLFFLNPDTRLKINCINNLVNFLIKNKNIGIVAPLLLNKDNKPYPLQGTKKLTPFKAIICLSFLNKLFPNNFVAKDYWLMNWNKKTEKEVEVIPGTAFMIRKEIFKKIGGFDTNFFLFFEENDLCFRVQKYKYKIYILPSAKVIHLWGKSTKYLNNLKKIFNDSRFYYFKKHFGIFNARTVTLFTSIGKKSILNRLQILNYL